MSHKSSNSCLLGIISCHLDYLKIITVIGNFQLFPQSGVLFLITSFITDVKEKYSGNKYI